MKIVFDEYSDDYDAWYQTKTGAFIDMLETNAAFELLQPQKGQKILDVGCGTGNYSLKLAGMGCVVSGIDVSHCMLGRAKEKAEQAGLQISFSHMDANHLAFEDNAFESAISMAAFEFIETPHEVYRELLRVVKPGGIIVIGAIQKGGAWQKLYASDAFKDSAYASASFKTREALVSLDKASFVAASECLYIPPDTDEANYTMENEMKHKSQNWLGGFICVSFQKQA